MMTRIILCDVLETTREWFRKKIVLWLFISGIFLVILAPNQADSMVSDGPAVIENDITYVNATAGTTAILTCTMAGKDPSKSLVWLGQQKKAIALDGRRLVSDERFNVDRPTDTEWNLHIRNVRFTDQGTYTCMYNTYPRLQHDVVLSVHKGEEDKDCLLFECYNNGTVVKIGLTCICECTVQFTGIVCETELLPSKWPDGPYALLMHRDGCPETLNHGWSTGFIHFSTHKDVLIGREFNYSNVEPQRERFSQKTAGPVVSFTNNSFRLDFCFKHPGPAGNSPRLWPTPRVTVYGYSNTCLTGYKEYIDFLQLPPTRYFWTDGHLPYFKIFHDIHGAMLITRHCILSKASTSKNTRYDGPFIRVKQYKTRCPYTVDGFDIEEETVQFMHLTGRFNEYSDATNLSVCTYTPKAKDLQPSAWPGGPYAVPMLTTGCPEPLDHGWVIGHISITAVFGGTKFNECKSIVPFGHVIGEYNSTSSKLYFCYKYGQQDSGSGIQWPRGQYIILAGDEGCPKGFKDYYVWKSARYFNSWSASGTLPYFEFQRSEMEQESNLKLRFCEKEDEHSEFSAGWKKPFAFVKGPACNDVKGFRVEEIEVILYGYILCVYTPLGIDVCPSEDFRCPDGRCVRFTHRCDGDDDCEGGEDEHNCTRNCNKGHFFCDNECLPNTLLCDGVDNCVDSFDELDYHCEQKCYEYEFKCHSGECVKKQLICDDIKDCKDGSDEHFDNCNLRCTGETMFCRRSNPVRCIANNLLCNGHAQCDDKLDENENICSSMCPAHSIYLGREFRSSITRPVCMETQDSTQAEKAYGLGNFCNNRDRCTMIKEVCDDLNLETDLGQSYDEPYSTKFTTSCQRTMGLRDGRIPDAQLLASSHTQEHEAQMVRPSKQSWCPMTTDMYPYLQIELGTVSVIGGIVIHNSVHVASFRVQYAIYSTDFKNSSLQYQIWDNSFKNYTEKNFEIDQSNTLAKAHMFLFLRPFLARYVRIRPSSSTTTNMCFQMELLGCSQSGYDHHRISYRQFEEINLMIFGPYELTSMFLAPDRIYRWNISTPGDGYVKLSFLNIKLFQQTVVHNNRCPYDMISFDDLFEPISAKHNGLNPVYPTDRLGILMTFVSCVRDTQSNGGFVVRLTQEDIPTIWVEIKDSNFREGKLITSSLLGLFVDIPTQHRWDLHSAVHEGLLVLTFTSFNIPCGSGFELIIYSDRMHMGSSLCNSGNRPRTVYNNWILTITFQYPISCVNCITRHDPEGFSANLEIEKVEKYHEMIYLNDSETEPIPDGQFEVFIVKSPKLMKRYRFSYQESFEDWFTQAQFCQQLGYRLVVIHDQTEMELLQSWLLYQMSELLTARTGPSRDLWPSKHIYVHIGLNRYKGVNGGLKYVWQDGTSPSFTAWDTGDPNRNTDNKCTAMRIDMATRKAHWVTQPCNNNSVTNVLFASLCEQPISKTPAHNVSYMNMEDDPTNATSVHAVRLFRCQSNEWIRKLALCDGIPDCQDGSDESNCAWNSNDISSKERFQCKTGEIVRIGQVCDHISDCTDNSDEFCTMPLCADGELRCANEQCIPDSGRCNAVEDCIDGSDEQQCQTCSDKTAFGCRGHCIDKYLACDNVQDCEHGSDEADCDVTYTSCLEVWGAGYSSYYHKEQYIECHFNVVDEQLQVTASVDLGGEWKPDSADTNFEKQEINTSVLERFGDQCSFEITVTCMEYSTLANCSSQTYRITFSNSSGVNINTSSLNILVETSGVLVRRSKQMVDHLVRVSSALCTSGPVDPGQHIRCGEGKTVSVSRKCLYDLTRAGVIDGCRNYKHLDNCENFTCPTGYFKCSSSFCLAQRYLCDGERQCPGGEDEYNCWCDGSRTTTALIYSEDVDETVLLYIGQFARQLYSKHANVYTISYTTNMNGQTYDVRKALVGPFNTGIHIEVETFTTDKHTLFKDILARLKNSTNVNLINFKFNEPYAIAGDIPNSQLVGKLFQISIDPSIKQQVTVSTTEKETILRFRSWKVLATTGSVLFPTLCQGSLANTCKNQFQCKSSKICLPLHEICDGIAHCPFEDDESRCDFECHQKCKCQMYLADCQSTNFTQLDFSNLPSTVRVLDLSRNNMFKDGVLRIPKRFPYLIRCRLSNCGITSVSEETFLNAINIKYLDLSFNKIKFITESTFIGLEHLEELKLDGNHQIDTIQPRSFHMLSQLISLSIINTKLSELMPNTFWGLTVGILNISNNIISQIHNRSFNMLSAVHIDLRGNFIESLHNVKILDLSSNKLKIITNKTFAGLTNLEMLNLNGNFHIKSIQPNSFKMLPRLSSLTITNTRLSEILPNTFWGLNVSLLNISFNRINNMHNRSFNGLTAEVIDFRGNDITTFDSDMFVGVTTITLKEIRTPAFKFCCVKPKSLSDDKCWPHQDEFSSCEDLMRNSVLQSLVWVLGIAAIVANLSTILYRCIYDRNSLKIGFGVFVTNLAASDFLMGVYLLIIAIADLAFRKRYMIMDEYWRHSGWCDFAGVLATVSSEASVLLMCLITVDRFLVIKYPFGQVRFRSRSSKLATLISWSIAWIIALVPLVVQEHFKGEFYSTSGVCLALPLSQERQAGWMYSFLIYVALNFVAFILIAIGQLIIFIEIKKSSKRIQTARSQRRNDVRIAKNLLLVLITDFLCWFPTGLMAIMATSTYVIWGDVYAWTAVMIVPVNSALNPFLYTLAAVLNKKTLEHASAKGAVDIRTKGQGPVLLNNLRNFLQSGIQCNMEDAKPAITDVPKVPDYQPLDELQNEQTVIDEKEVMKAYDAITDNMTVLHGHNLVYGGFSIQNILYSSASGKIQLCLPALMRPGDAEDKEKDIHDVNCVLEQMLKFTK